MAIVAPTPITVLPTVPTLSDISTFSSRTDAFINALPEFRTDANDLATNVYNNAQEVSGGAVTATTQAGIATTQAGIATTQAGIATTQAGIATTQASNAAGSYTSFDSRYLGPKASDPILDNQGGSLTVGALYFSTTLNNMRIYDGANWILAAGQITGTFAVLRESHTATAAQTVFNLTNTYITGTNTIMVYKNGVRLLAADYTETSSNSITMTSAAAAGDEYFFEIGVVATGTSTNAGNITFSPAGGVSSTNVQAAITELDTEKQAVLVSGTSIKTINGTSLLGSGDVTITTAGSGGTTSTASITLTASSAAAMTVTPATPGLYVTLPDATTCTKADNLYAVYNAGDYDYGVKDSAGTQLGWIRARTGAMIGLADNASAAGVWAYYGLEKTGITASYVNSTLTNMGSTIRRIALDANRTCFLFGGVDCYAIVYDASTQTWGSATLVRATVGNGAFLGVLAATDKVLVCSCSSTTAFEAVTLSISTTTVTVNTGTKATATLAGSWASFGQLITVGTSWVVSYGRATTTSAIRAITVSGTTPTIGAESAITTAVAQSATLFASGSVVRTICQGSGGTSVLCTPYTVSGSTLTLGTQATAPATNAANRSFLNGNGNIVCHYINTTHYATIFKLTGTTEAASSVSLGTAPGSMPTQADCLVVSASKTVFAAMDTANTYFNILTDTAGTASAGTQITFAHGGSAIVGVYGAIASGNTARFGYASVSSNGTFGAVTVDCSAASPVMGAVQNLAYVSGVSDTWGMYPAASDKYGVRAFTNLICGTSISINLSGGGTSYSDWGVTINSLVIRTPLFIPCGARSVSTLNFGVTGASANESWCNGMNNVGGTIGQQIYRVEAAA